MDEQLCFLGYGVSLGEKIEKAIENLREYEREALRRDPVNGYYLCDSYGKDSGVILHLAKMSGVKFVAHHNLTTLDPPELIMHGRKHHPETVVHKPVMPMLTRLTTGSGGPPTRINRWCCEEYKESKGSGMVRVFGVRAAESANRKANWKTWTPHRQDGWVLNPILYWTDEDVWQFTKQCGIPYCCLYDEGFKRLGCIGCPQADKQRANHFARWPKYERAWKQAIARYWEKTGSQLRNDGQERSWVKKGIKSAEDLWLWWMNQLPESDDDDCQMGLF